MTRGRGADFVALGLLLFAALFFGFGYGFVAATKKLPPAPQLWALHSQMTDFLHNWKNDFGIEPTRHLVPARARDRQPVTVVDAGAVGDEAILITGLTPRRSSLNSAVLYDPSGRELHAWPLDYDLIKPGGEGELNVFAHGILAMPDGSLVVNFDAGSALARIGPCGDIMWKLDGSYHHDVSASYDGTLWTLLDNAIVQISPDDGTVIRYIDVAEDVMTAHGREGVLAIQSEEDGSSLTLSDDPFHLNAVEVLSPEKAAAFPMFDAGDLLISMRNLNMVAVLDGKTHDIKWQQMGPWHRQHDPHFLDDGTISVYDNRMGLGRSRIVTVDPANGRVETRLEDSPSTPFYSWRRGKQQLLPNGNLLVTESEMGRAFMTAPDGWLIWEFNNVYDSEWNGVVADAVQLPRDFFHAGALACGGPTAPPRT